MTHDPLDRLRDADPIRDVPLPDPTSERAVALRDEILGIDAHRDRSHPARRWIAGGAVLAAGLATAAALAVTTARPADPTSIGCYAGPSVAADTAVLAATGSSPVAQCRELWLSGDMDPTVTDPDHVPTLVACVLDTGRGIGVFPAGSCDDIETDDGHLRPHPGGEPAPTATPREPAGDEGTQTGLPMPDYHTSDETVRRALEEVRLAMLDECLTLDAAIELAEEALARHGLQGWTVGPIFEGHTARTCAGFFPDAAERAIWFTPEPVDPGRTPGSG